MSFILDALRKSDQQRQRNQGPVPMIGPAPITSASPPPLWWYGLLAAVLLGAGILIGVLQRSASEPVASPLPAEMLHTSAQQANPSTHPLNNPVGDPGASALTSLPLTSAPVRRPEPSLNVVHAPAISPLATVQIPLPPTAAVATVIAPTPLRREEPARTAPAAVVQETAPPVSEMPPALQQELPKLVVLVHSYASAPKSRFVLIGDRKWHEEESPAPGLKLEQITPDGMIFSYKGYRFRRGINP